MSEEKKQGGATGGTGYLRASEEEILVMVERWKRGERYEDIAQGTQFTADQVKNKLRYFIKKHKLALEVKNSRDEATREKMDVAAKRIVVEGVDPDEIAESFNLKKNTLLRKTTQQRKKYRMKKLATSNEHETEVKSGPFTYKNADQREGVSPATENIFAKAATVRWLQNQTYQEIAESLNSSPEHVGLSIRSYLSEHPEVVRQSLEISRVDTPSSHVS